MLTAVSGSQNMHVLCQALGADVKIEYVRGKGKIFAMLLNSRFRRPRADVKRVNPNVANLLPAKTAELAPEHAICAFARRRISHTVKYSSTYPRPNLRTLARFFSVQVCNVRAKNTNPDDGTSGRFKRGSLGCWPALPAKASPRNVIAHIGRVVTVK